MSWIKNYIQSKYIQCIQSREEVRRIKSIDKVNKLAKQCSCIRFIIFIDAVKLHLVYLAHLYSCPGLYLVNIFWSMSGPTRLKIWSLSLQLFTKFVFILSTHFARNLVFVLSTRSSKKFIFLCRFRYRPWSKP